MSKPLDIAVAQRLQDVQEYYFSRKLREIEQLRQAGHVVYNLGIGSPDLPPHPEVIQVLQEQSALPHVHAYQSYKGAAALRQAMAHWYASWYGVSLDAESEILPLIGSKEGITHICMTYLNEGDAALVPNPGYPAYASAVKVSGATPVPFSLTAAHQYFPDFEALDRLVAQHGNIKLMFINYPHMPTGQLPTRDLFDALVAWATRHQILLVHDNPYSFILNDTPMSLLASPGAMDVALELNSLSKSHNLAGWRVGMLAGNAQRLAEVLRFKSNLDSGMFLPVQLAAARALQLEAAWYQHINAVYTRRRTIACAILEALGCTYSTQQAGMFVWAAIPAHVQDGFALSDEVLHKTHVFITPGGIFGSEGNGYLRISLCSTEQVLQQALERIQQAFENIGQ